MQMSGGHLLPPVQTLVATIIFATGENASRLPYPFKKYKYLLATLFIERMNRATPQFSSPRGKMHIDSRIRSAAQFLSTGKLLNRLSIDL